MRGTARRQRHGGSDEGVVRGSIGSTVERRNTELVHRPELLDLRRVVVAVVVAVALTGCGTDAVSSDASDRVTTSTAPEHAATPGEPDPVGSSTVVADVPTTGAAAAAPRPAGIVVTRVVDGDTVELADGSKVRLTGIDTPERGQCGFGEASTALNDMVTGREVVLVAGARDDSDRYGRLLRYLEVDGVDVNLAMIQSGWAIARYDSRDGYGRHEREDAYIAADVGTPVRPECAGAATPQRQSSPTTAAATVPPSGGATSPRFGTCKEAKANGFGPFVKGLHPEYDWYRDADRDGTVCE